MPKVRLQPQRREWLPDLPPVPTDETRELVGLARRCGVWFGWCNDPRAQSEWGGRYRVSERGTRRALFTSDELGAVHAWLDAHAARTAATRGGC